MCNVIPGVKQKSCRKMQNAEEEKFRKARYNTGQGSDRVGTDVMHHVMHNICDALCDAKQDKYHDAFMVHNT